MASIVPKALYTYAPALQSVLNPEYRGTQPWNHEHDNGSRNVFKTDYGINGKYLRSRSDNQYFWMANKNVTVSDLLQGKYYIPSYKVKERFRDYDPAQHVVLRLEFTDQNYFVENNQDIQLDPGPVGGTPTVTVLNVTSLDELLATVPKFVPIPE
jgi:hypothetical protein